MDINEVYVYEVYRIDFCDEQEGSIQRFFYDEEFGLIKSANVKISFVKKALVYYSLRNRCFIDIETKERYCAGIPVSKNNGNLFVDVLKSRIYGKEIMGTSRQFYSKKKILKRYMEYKAGENNECK